ncbi:hypothetical protein AAZX31_03G103000 [Glycine max]|uniref:Uncharacterized protein n=2 Tax=Glycine subgen. Soja TaxID=1462606 RepID=C6T287_SOYBN|nr:Protein NONRESPONDING TO OXYLIPINS 2, mitochondrial-like [Glycine max]XP_028225096.1 uncharacterized protein LOC114406562 [Glycine soja]ACU15731.1 unknown [Glycine max]KAG5043158.1 hypothetical protein JHK87_007073 [Glycine soja]KAG5054940.1 hypothetical protein JHK85_007450 [Glycine max]KAG5072028.1 hypothetical protein JHK86_007239 [Glycine max]KAH1069578.1 hypothetical protein GYH30_006965 [Glycine max]|eukprot:NP_001236697.1 uncharacterized protein LOC100500605 [Glycine max]
MASFSHCTRRFISLSSMKSAVRTISHSPLLNATVPHRPFSPLIRTCVYRLGSVQSLLPLHSTVATARMVSSLSIDSRNCEALSHATLCCNHPGP